ncbi:MAG: hypothetical protein ACKVS9_08200 [Phycisphaerae bacterium]
MSEPKPTLLIDGADLVYRSPSIELWRLPIERIRLIGEATDQNGPFADDYWYWFAPAADDWYEASFYSEGRDTVFGELERRFGATFPHALMGSTDFASNILYPPELAGRPLLRYEKVPHRGFLKALLLGMIGMPFSVRQEATEQVMQFLRERP